MPYQNNKRSSSKAQNGKGGKKSGAKFANDKFIMMQIGKQYLDEGDYGYKTRITPSTTNDEWSWCVREKVNNVYVVTHWFGVKKGQELLFRAIVAGQAIGTSAFYEKDGDLIGNARVNLKGIATEKEIAAAKRAADNEAWEDADDEDEEEEELEEEEEPAPRKAKATAKPAQAKPKARYAPIEEEEEEETSADEYDPEVGSYDEDDEMPF